MEFKKKSMIFFILLVFLTICGSVRGENQADTRQDSPEPVAVETALFDGFLYFADIGGGSLKALPKQFASNLNAHELGRDILAALMEGPPNSLLAPTFPRGTTVRTLFISEQGKAWVDLGIRGCLENMDTMSELLAIYSLVNSLTVNIPGVTQVKLLVNGSDAATLGGHVSLKYFYKTNMLIVK